MIIVVDAGNTNIKWYEFRKGTIINHTRLPYDDFFKKESTDFFSNRFENAIICNVSAFSTKKIMEKIPVATYHEFTHTTKIPLTIAYATPHTLGLDRIAAAVGAETHCPTTNKLIVDFGTAITIDFVNADKTYVGGNISLGMRTRFQALHDYTGKLPLIEPTDDVSEIGTTTKEAIQNGVINGIKYEIDEYIRIYSSKYQDLTIFFTGGDCHFFEKSIKNVIFAQQNLVAIGLYAILKYNEM